MLNIQLMKKINEKMPNIVKKTFFPIMHKKFISNKTFLQTVDLLKSLEGKEDQVIEKIQKKFLKDILVYSFEHVKYYRNLFKACDFNPYKFDDFKQLEVLPYLTKEIVQSNFNDLISDEKINFYVTYTGGTTGRPMKIIHDSLSIFKERAFVYNFWKKLGYDFRKHKLATFRGVEFGRSLYKYNPIYKEIVLSPFMLNSKNFRKYIEIINNFNPDFLTGYPSAILSFCKLLGASKYKLKKRINGVFLISETFSEDERKFIKEVLNCEVRAFYGHSERVVFAEEDGNGNYKFNKLYGYSQIVKVGDEYLISGTGFLNRKMPLIKYLTDDVAVVNDKGFRIKGRWLSNDFLVGKNGEIISMAAFNFHSDAMDKVQIYQFEQYDKGVAFLNIIPLHKLEDDDIRKIEKVCNEKVQSSIKIFVRIVDEIKYTKRGKYRMVINYLNEKDVVCNE